MNEHFRYGPNNVWKNTEDHTEALYSILSKDNMQVK